jgi:hypothetical protein
MRPLPSILLCLAFVLPAFPIAHAQTATIEFHDLHIGRSPDGNIGISYRVENESWARIRGRSPVIRAIVTPRQGNPVRAHVPLENGGVFSLPASDGTIHLYVEIEGATVPFRIARLAGPFVRIEADSRHLSALPHRGVPAR